MDTEGLGENRFVPKPLALGGGTRGEEYFSSTPKSLRGKRLPLGMSNRALLGCLQVASPSNTPKADSPLCAEPRGAGERGGLRGRGQERLHPVSLPLRQGPRQRLARPRGAPQPGPGDPRSLVERDYPPGAPGPGS